LASAGIEAPSDSNAAETTATTVFRML
jgi:hypothetical protein